MSLKVAIVGGAPSLEGAPFGCPDWEIWACSTAFNKLDHATVHAWFEVHDPATWADGVKALVGNAGRKAPVYLRPDLVARYPNALPLPRDAVLARFDGLFLTSTIAWMMAQTLLDGRPELGLYGVEMCMDDEYGDQLAGCRHFMGIAKVLGVPVTVPAGCNVLRPGRVYPDWSETPAYRHCQQERDRIAKQIALIDQQIAGLDAHRHRLKGALEIYDHLMNNNWV